MKKILRDDALVSLSLSLFLYLSLSRSRSFSLTHTHTLCLSCCISLVPSLACSCERSLTLFFKTESHKDSFGVAAVSRIDSIMSLLQNIVSFIGLF